MKNVYIILMLSLSSCGVSTPDTVSTTTVVTPLPATSPTSMVGYWVLPNGGWADVYQDAEGLYTIRSMRLIVTNEDGSTGYVPVANTNALAIVNSTLYYNPTLAYVAATNNVKADVGNALLAANYLTELYFSLDAGVFNIQVVISNSNTMLFNHTVAAQ